MPPAIQKKHSNAGGVRRNKLTLKTGRYKGIPDTRKLGLSERVRALMRRKKYSAIEHLIDIASSEVTPLEQKIEVAKALAPYEAPTLKSVDISGEIKEGLTIKLVQFGDAASQAKAIPGTQVPGSPPIALPHVVSEEISEIIREEVEKDDA